MASAEFFAVLEAVSGALLRLPGGWQEISKGEPLNLVLERRRIYRCGFRLAVGLPRPRPGRRTTPALYPVPVRRLRGLPPASSLPRIAATAVALG